MAFNNHKQEIEELEILHLPWTLFLKEKNQPAHFTLRGTNIYKQFSQYMKCIHMYSASVPDMDWEFMIP